jgi:hypothetical protein
MARRNTNNYATSPASKGHNLFSHLLRTLQFLSALTSLILFSIRIAKIIRLTNRASQSNGAVEGILAAAVLYTIIATLLQCLLKAGASNIFRMILVVFDILFVGAFIAVAVLTSPKRHGSSAPCTKAGRQVPGSEGINCSLPWGTFILAIVSTLLHAVTAGWHSFRDHKKGKRETVVEKDQARDEYRNGHAGMDGRVR